VIAMIPSEGSPYLITAGGSNTYTIPTGTYRIEVCQIAGGVTKSPERVDSHADDDYAEEFKRITNDSIRNFLDTHRNVDDVEGGGSNDLTEENVPLLTNRLKCLMKVHQN